MHNRNTKPGQVVACSEDRRDRITDRLRFAAHALAYAFGGKWLLARLANLFMFLANLRTYGLHGRTAIVRPSRSGGADHGARAVARGANPMVFGGAAHTCDECRPPRWRVPVIRTVMTTGGSWMTVRRWRLARSMQAGLCDEYRILRGGGVQ